MDDKRFNLILIIWFLCLSGIVFIGAYWMFPSIDVETNLNATINVSEKSSLKPYVKDVDGNVFIINNYFEFDEMEIGNEYYIEYSRVFLKDLFSFKYHAGDCYVKNVTPI
jgi:hypothetical protein